ncbi:MAG: LicD family protein [Bacteroidales bacterium]|nr:LicD family protein [Bacteroidales bacterium]
MSRKIDLEEMKHIQLELLDDVHSFCLANGIRYSLCGGTLLGAVRHQGYIPWDDDIDIMMPRSDYERFIQMYQSEQNTVIDLRKDATTVELCVKVSRNGTSMTDKLLGRTLWGINIDIFPVDGIPDDYKNMLDEILHLRKRLGQICPFYRVVQRHKIQWFLKYCIKRIVFFYPGSIISLKQRIYRISTRYNLKETPLGAALFGSYGKKEVIPSETFKHFTNISFEGKDYLAIQDFHTYLHALYGNYMKLPPEKDRVSHHLYEVYAE